MKRIKKTERVFTIAQSTLVDPFYTVIHNWSIINTDEKIFNISISALAKTANTQGV